MVENKINIKQQCEKREIFNKQIFVVQKVKIGIGTYLAVGGIGNLIIVCNLKMCGKAYEQHVEPTVFQQFQSFCKFDEFYFDLHDQFIYNMKTDISKTQTNQKKYKELKLSSEDFIQQESVSCYKVISEHLKSLKSQDAYICNSNIKSQLGFDIQILLEQRGGHILQ